MDRISVDDQQPIDNNEDLNAFTNEFIKAETSSHGFETETNIQLNVVVVDNNTKSCLIVQCLFEDETIENYKWFLGFILQATNSISPARCYQFRYFTAGIQSTQRVKVINYLIKEATNSTTSLCNLQYQAQKILDNKAK
ncbi:1974_t:CDS:2 [Funneliformis geosporum]|uniref:1974_t:CDS:1 n=1 Tax=Funneliformis geosporum TaxID=1117311 RepID=A0A9W4T529_9GLOM|nr:1974_t:CDS:2 [Funneliformis geosporum]